jgi:hypothetical protein
MLSILINSKNHQRKEYFENVFWKIVEDVLCELMVTKVFAKALEDIDFQEVVACNCPFKRFLVISLFQGGAGARRVGSHIVDAIKIHTE